jgi:hypothetical protein
MKRQPVFQVRQEVEIEDYALSQTTLDEVFINFASKLCGNDSERPVRQQSIYGSLSIDEVPFMPVSADETTQSETDITQVEVEETLKDANRTETDVKQSQTADGDVQTYSDSALETQLTELTERRPQLTRQQAATASAQPLHQSTPLFESLL